MSGMEADGGGAIGVLAARSNFLHVDVQSCVGRKKDVVTTPGEYESKEYKVSL